MSNGNGKDLKPIARPLLARWEVEMLPPTRKEEELFRIELNDLGFPEAMYRSGCRSLNQGLEFLDSHWDDFDRHYSEAISTLASEHGCQSNSVWMKGKKSLLEADEAGHPTAMATLVSFRQMLIHLKINKFENIKEPAHPIQSGKTSDGRAISFASVLAANSIRSRKTGDNQVNNEYSQMDYLEVSSESSFIQNESTSEEVDPNEFWHGNVEDDFE